MEVLLSTKINRKR